MGWTVPGSVHACQALRKMRHKRTIHTRPPYQYQTWKNSMQMPIGHACPIGLQHHECSVQSWKANSLFGSHQEYGGSRETGNIPGRHYVLRYSTAISKTLSSLNELCFLLATTTDKPVTALPPTEHAFKQHVLRAQYQVAVWCQSRIAKMNSNIRLEKVLNLLIMSIVQPNSLFRKDELCPTMYKNESAPAEVRDITHLYCTDKSCCGQKCQCVIAGLECIDICTCGGQCENQRETSVVENDAEVADFSL